MPLFVVYALVALLGLLLVGMVVFIAFASLDLIGYVIAEVPFVPIPRYVAEHVIRLAPRTDGVFYDLGSGDGRMVIAIASAYPAMNAIGIEKAPLPTLITRIFKKNRPPNARFLYEDFNDISLADASFVYGYLLTKISHRLEPKFEAELPPGSRLILCDFPLKIRRPNQTVPVAKGGNKHTLYVYDF